MTDRPEIPAPPEANTLERGRTTSDREPDRYVFRLYTFGASPSSVRALANLRRLCDEHLPGRYELEVVDLHQDGLLVAADQIIAAPTLVKRLPLPVRQFVGDLSNEEVVLVGLDLRYEPAFEHPGMQP